MLLIVASVSALAADAVSFSAKTIVQYGLDNPSITLTPTVSGQIDVQLSCGVGDHTYAIQERLVPGRPITLELTGLGKGMWDCHGRVDLHDDAGGSGQMPLKLKVGSVEPLALDAGDGDILHLQKILKVHANQSLGQATATLYGVDGAVLETVEADLSEPILPIFQWSTDQEVVKIDVVGTDRNGFQAKLDLSPWWVEIPHEDVVFPSGSHAIPGSESHKLEHSWSDVAAVFAKYGAMVEVKLYVAGYTDTVGNPASNQALSERRARSIASWFRQRGFSGPVFYQGFGESVLAVATPDETDEQANRRAIYVLGAQAPPTSPPLPRDDWKPL